MARWEDALDAQLDMVVQHSTNERLRAYTEGWFLSYSGKMRYETQGGWRPENIADRIASMAFNADAIWVDPDMMTIWEGALESFQPEPLTPEDLVTPAGFIYLPRPWYTKDVNSKHVATRAILWHPTQHVMLQGEQLKAAEAAMGGELPAPYSVRMGDMEVMTRRTPAGFVADGLAFCTFSNTRDPDDYGWEPSKTRFTGLALNHFMPWPYGSKFDLHVREDGERDMGALAVQALWRLMQQTLAVRSQHRPDRHTRKRFARARLPEREVTVVRLRRVEPEHEHGDPKVVHWTHRWLVGGHWRLQYYPSVGMHRQIWISPYVKGPEELPLRPRKARVFELVR